MNWRKWSNSIRLLALLPILLPSGPLLCGRLCLFVTAPSDSSFRASSCHRHPMETIKGHCEACPVSQENHRDQACASSRQSCCVVNAEVPSAFARPLAFNRDLSRTLCTTASSSSGFSVAAHKISTELAWQGTSSSSETCSRPVYRLLSTLRI